MVNNSGGLWAIRVVSSAHYFWGPGMKQRNIASWVYRQDKGNMTLGWFLHKYALGYVYYMDLASHF